jgi:hypothetical protein
MEHQAIGHLALHANSKPFNGPGASGLPLPGPSIRAIAELCLLCLGHAAPTQVLLAHTAEVQLE